VSPVSTPVGLQEESLVGGGKHKMKTGYVVLVLSTSLLVLVGSGCYVHYKTTWATSDAWFRKFQAFQPLHHTSQQMEAFLRQQKLSPRRLYLNRPNADYLIIADQASLPTWEISKGFGQDKRTFTFQSCNGKITGYSVETPTHAF